VYSFNVGNLKITDPTNYVGLSILFGSGQNQMNVTIQHQDGTNEVITNVATANWFNAANPVLQVSQGQTTTNDVAWRPHARINASSGACDNSTQLTSSQV
jgi:hypothetical protein